MEDSRIQIETMSFHDWELSNISFSFPNVTINLTDKVYNKSTKITLHDVEDMYFESNHVQNVVESLHIFETFKDGKDHDVFNKLVKQRNLEELFIKTAADRQIFFIDPITGGELIASFSRLSLEAE